VIAALEEGGAYRNAQLTAEMRRVLEGRALRAAPTKDQVGPPVKLGSPRRRMDRCVAPLPDRATAVRPCASERKDMSIRRVVPNITSDKLEASRDFYVGLLGFQVAMDLGWIMTFASPGNPTAQISVLREDASAPVVPQITVEVADVDAVHAEAVRRGLEIVHPLTDEPWGVRRFFVKDPNGVVLNVAGHR
jgi:catechol 2,3-dioxygenase-like lactoylglutathione lyase family enzyme